MQLNEFYAILKVTVDDFVAHWRNMNYSHPKAWSLELSDLEWYDQFITYLEDKLDSQSTILENNDVK